MLILYGDDEQIAREIVVKALKAKGFKVHAIDTSRTEQMTVHLKSIVQEHGLPDVFILDGHNFLLDNSGNRLYDMTPLGMVSWLRQYCLSSKCKFVLFSNDDKLVEQARLNRNLDFFDAVTKSGKDGGLKVLLEVVERAAQIVV